MNIIIPLAGKGERFFNCGYTDPKPLIPIFEKCMIEYVIDNLSISNEDKVFIIYNRHLNHCNFSKYIHNKYNFIYLIEVNDTKGAADTLRIGIDHIINNYNHNKKCLILDCDTFYTENIIDIFNNSEDNLVFYTKKYDDLPIYSYIELNTRSEITNIKEKNKISNNANTGAYAFNDIFVLHEFCKRVVNDNIMFNGEHYTSCVISEMIKNNYVFKGYELNENFVFSLGTPIAVKEFIDSRHAFLFDLDGTIVITDDIYFNVWYEILIKYNIVLTKELYATYIQGNNDKYVLNSLLKNLNITLTELSLLKDCLFIKNISMIQVIDGIYEIINKIRLSGHKICIVTNCNRSVASRIVKYINIDKSIDFIISSDDCINGKPHPEPYNNAMHKYNIDAKRCIIFEDSKSGLLSAKNSNAGLLIGIETIYNSNELMNFDVIFSIKNYCGLNITEILNVTQTNTIHYLRNMIIKNTHISNINKIIIDEHKLKGGFIADVISYKIFTKNNTYSLILKYENHATNNLSIMANKLQLYQREYYFYTDISNKVTINVPRFYNLLFNENNTVIGIILENLLDKNYKINLDLNREGVDVSLKIVDRMASMHSVFWNKNLKEIFPKLKQSNDDIFCPFFTNFINDRYQLFKNNWCKILNHHQLELCDKIYSNFDKIQERFCKNNLTFIHGDIKSPNIFYDIENNYEPYFIDWQHCAIGKGCQDLVFFIIESFDIINVESFFNLLKEYYYRKLIEYNVIGYSFKEYEDDLYYAMCYIPFFTSVWFGTTPQDELIDKNFPYFFISKLFYLLERISVNHNTPF
jgi:HAD superfamily hydrolase (TIGR01509 family)